MKREALSPPAAPVIEMQDVTVVAMKDPDQRVVEGVNWSVAAGDFWALAGLHGSGKSDFLMMTAGLFAPARGTYRLFGETMPILEGTNLATRLRIGLVFDGGHLLNQLTIAQNVALPLRYHRNLTEAEAEARIGVALEAMDLTSWAGSTPAAIGHNWQRRAGLARALMLQPEVLLLDSPLRGLDPRHQNWWLDFLDQLSAGHALLGGRPVTLVATAENLRPWRGHAKEFALLEESRFVPLGGWDQAQQSSEPIVRDLIGPGLLANEQIESETR